MSFNYSTFRQFLLKNISSISQIFHFSQEKDFLLNYLSLEEYEDCLSAGDTNTEQLLHLILIFKKSEEMYFGLFERLKEIHEISSNVFCEMTKICCEKDDHLGTEKSLNQEMFSKEMRQLSEEMKEATKLNMEVMKSLQNHLKDIQKLSMTQENLSATNLTGTSSSSVDEEDKSVCKTTEEDIQESSHMDSPFFKEMTELWNERNSRDSKEQEKESAVGDGVQDDDYQRLEDCESVVEKTEIEKKSGIWGGKKGMVKNDTGSNSKSGLFNPPSREVRQMVKKHRYRGFYPFMWDFYGAYPKVDWKSKSSYWLQMWNDIKSYKSSHLYLPAMILPLEYGGWMIETFFKWSQKNHFLMFNGILIENEHNANSPTTIDVNLKFEISINEKVKIFQKTYSFMKKIEKYLFCVTRKIETNWEFPVVRVFVCREEN